MTPDSDDDDISLMGEDTDVRTYMSRDPEFYERLIAKLDAWCEPSNLESVLKTGMGSRILLLSSAACSLLMSRRRNEFVRMVSMSQQVPSIQHFTRRNVLEEKLRLELFYLKIRQMEKFTFFS